MESAMVFPQCPKESSQAVETIGGIFEDARPASTGHMVERRSGRI